MYKLPYKYTHFCPAGNHPSTLKVVHAKYKQVT